MVDQRSVSVVVFFACFLDLVIILGSRIGSCVVVIRIAVVIVVVVVAVITAVRKQDW